MSRIAISKRISAAALLAAVAVLLGYVEFLIPIVPPVAGIKLGLGNTAVLMALHTIRRTDMALGVLAVKLLACAALFAGMGGLPYAAAGGIASFVTMLVLCRCGALSAAGISAAGGAVHMAAQVAVAALMTSTGEVMLLLPVLLAVGTLTGTLNGCIVNLMERHAGRFLEKSFDA